MENIWANRLVFSKVSCFVLLSLLFTHGCTVEFKPKHPVCGNGVVEGDEECDGEDLNGKTCESLGLGEGTLGCKADCTFDTGSCKIPAMCGNNIKEESEVCDGTDLGGETCKSQGFHSGTLACLPDCSGFDTTGCEIGDECGNNIKEESEVCDGTDLGGETCESQGFYSGTLACLPDCSGFDTSQCDLGPCPHGWVYIDAGDFEMGCSEDDDCWVGVGNESPRHTVTLSHYCIQVTQVSVSQYRECKDAGGCTNGEPTEGGGTSWYNWTTVPEDREEHPINGVTWDEAREYCIWVGGDLPTEAQWEKAGRGTDERKYPWGPEAPSCLRCNWNPSGQGLPYGCNQVTEGPGTWPVGYLTTTQGDSFYGLKDMAGNVWEWTLDCYDPYFYGTCLDLCVDPVNEVDDCLHERVSRGGSFSSGSPWNLRVVYRNFADPVVRSYWHGFRCVRIPFEEQN